MTDSTTVDNQTRSASTGWGVAGQGTLAWFVTVCVGVAALTLSAKVSVPSWSVPMSMQVLALATLAMALGWLVMCALGLTWLGHVVGWHKSILALGLKPFILGDLLRIVAVGPALPWLHRLRRR